MGESLPDVPVESGRFTVRHARFDDVDELTRLERAVFVSYYAAHRFSSEQFRRYLKRAATIALVVTHKGRLAGYVLGVELRGSRRGVARLHSIGVDPAQRHKGLGHCLMRAFVAGARRRGNRRVYLDVAATNRTAQTLFLAHGFRPVRRMPRLYSSAVDGVRMRKTLGGKPCGRGRELTSNSSLS